MVWLERNLKAILFQPLPWAGTPFTRAGWPSLALNPSRDGAATACFNHPILQCEIVSPSPICSKSYNSSALCPKSCPHQASHRDASLPCSHPATAAGFLLDSRSQTRGYCCVGRVSAASICFPSSKKIAGAFPGARLGWAQPALGTGSLCWKCLCFEAEPGRD